MKITKTLCVTNREEWRAWLKRHHATEPEIWLVYYRKETGKPCIPFNDAVEEALCFGWIDSTLKPMTNGCFAQRFTPRRPRSPLSEMNKERIRRLIKNNRMTRFGLARIEHAFQEHKTKKRERFEIPVDILNALKKDPDAWEHFNRFPESYKRIRIGWIDAARRRPEVFQQRLRYFLKMTAQNKRFGMVQ
ncbi:MAG: YdeI/OmpD-associated family protein [Methylococcales bacterium]